MNDVKNLMDADKLFAGSEMFRIIFSRFERMEKELASLREKCKGVDDLKAKIMDLEEQHRRESAITCKTISGLIDVVSSIKADNMILKQQIETLRGCHDHGLEDVKVRHLLPICRDSLDYAVTSKHK
ncbi:hypothetical protein L798_00327 [Zootermopsis nevadensis]|uniref:Uncharacterized protein n=1 Tax=Zootermopsis nevadensis TaxID=136037 RepID=A0A067QKW7_ZOONE|nr:hypothetical protein L798_00327 [Zootermopsis nevadensis]